MSAARPSSLPENAELAFIGEERWAPARLTPRQAKWLASSQNPSGRPNADVLRGYTGLAAGQIAEQTQIDFPLNFTEQEAALYQAPFSKLRIGQSSADAVEFASSGRRPCLPTPTPEAPVPPRAITQARTVVSRDKPGICPSRRPAKGPVATPEIQTSETSEEPAWWINPYANAELRTALARLDRYLAMPVAAEIPMWNWIDSHTLPDATLVAVARDDDFISGLLQSQPFHCWWRRNSPQLSPIEIVASFPFLWPPSTLLSALNRTQEDHRHAIARAARSGNQEQINSNVAAAYGWSSDLTDDEILAELVKLNHERIHHRIAGM